MSKLNYKERFIQLIRELQQNRFIVVDKTRVGDPTLDIVFNSVIKMQQIKVFKEIALLYQEMDSCEIEWSCQIDNHPELSKFTKNDSIINGQIIIRPIELFLTYDQKLDSNVWQTNLTPEEKKQLVDFRYFDFNDDYTKVGFIINNGRIEDELFFLLQ